MQVRVGGGGDDDDDDAKTHVFPSAPRVLQIA